MNVKNIPFCSVIFKLGGDGLLMSVGATHLSFSHHHFKDVSPVCWMFLLQIEVKLKERDQACISLFLFISVCFPINILMLLKY